MSQLKQPMHTLSQPVRRKRGFMFKIIIMAIIASAVSLIIRGVGSSSNVEAVPKKVPLNRLSVTQSQQLTVFWGVEGAAEVGAKQLNQFTQNKRVDRTQLGKNYTFISVPINAGATDLKMSSPDLHRPHVVIAEMNLRSAEPCLTREQALENAVEVARKRLEYIFRTLDPPLETPVTTAMVQEEFLVKNSVRELLPTEQDKQAWVAAKVEPNRLWVEFDLEVTDDQLRELRSEQRIPVAMKYFLMVMILLGIIHVFLRLDNYTKGYLTWVLGLSGVLLGAVALSYFLKM